jgi:hypothetical protein
MKCDQSLRRSLMKSAVLMGIGAILIVVGIVMSNNANDSDARDQRINDAVSDVGFGLSGRYEYKKADKHDRMPVYLIGGLGGLTILIGIVTLGTGKKREAR